MKPLKIHKAGDPETIALGEHLIREGKVGCIVLAGGDGSRLGWNGPKGTFPISLVKQKTLFQLLHERVRAASTFFGRDLKLAVMTSPINEEVTRQAFPPTVDFFSQQLVPLLDMDQNPLSEKRPNGNGEVFKQFINSRLYEKWRSGGIEYIKVIFIDNPLADPFDSNQIGVHANQKAELTIKAIKKHPNESVGVIGMKEGKIAIIEYSENPPENWDLANTGLFCVHSSFVEKIEKASLPIHIVKKFIDGKPVYKQETFIFDLLPFADKTEVILYPREEIFAPLKSRDDVGKVQRALLDRDRKMFSHLTGKPMVDQIFELDPSFHYPTSELRAKWQGVELPSNSYIIP